LVFRSVRNSGRPAIWRFINDIWCHIVKTPRYHEACSLVERSIVEVDSAGFMGRPGGLVSAKPP
jgi:hypothetical protein